MPAYYNPWYLDKVGALLCYGMVSYQINLPIIWRVASLTLKIIQQYKLHWSSSEEQRSINKIVHQVDKYIYIIKPPTQRRCWWVYWLHSVHPSVCPSICPASRVHSVAPTVRGVSISYLYIFSGNFRRCVMYKASSKFAKFEFLAFFF